MTNREITEKYFELANAGKWDEWCDLFSADMVYQEQLAGRIDRARDDAPYDGWLSRRL